MSKIMRFWAEDAKNIRCVREADYDLLVSQLAERLRQAYEWGYGDGQSNPNGYSSEEDRDVCVASLVNLELPL